MGLISRGPPRETNIAWVVTCAVRPAGLARMELSPPTHFCACVGISQLFQWGRELSVWLQFFLSCLEHCLLVPVTSLFTLYRLAAYTRNVISFWPLNLYESLYSFCLVCGRWCFSCHSHFYYPDPSGGLTAWVSCEEHRKIKDGFSIGSPFSRFSIHTSCHPGTGNPLGSSAGSGWVQFCPSGIVFHYSCRGHVRYVLLLCVSHVRPPTPWHWIFVFRTPLVGLFLKRSLHEGGPLLLDVSDVFVWDGVMPFILGC